MNTEGTGTYRNALTPVTFSKERRQLFIAESMGDVVFLRIGRHVRKADVFITVGNKVFYQLYDWRTSVDQGTLILCLPLRTPALQHRQGNPLHSWEFLSAVPVKIQKV